jgi:hypothetical protein
MAAVIQLSCRLEYSRTVLYNTRVQLVCSCTVQYCMFSGVRVHSDMTRAQLQYCTIQLASYVAIVAHKNSFTGFLTRQCSPLLCRRALHYLTLTVFALCINERSVENILRLPLNYTAHWGMREKARLEQSLPFGSRPKFNAFL